MTKTSNLKNTHNNEGFKKVRHQDMQNYVKPLYCSCCDTTIFHTSLDEHYDTQYHKTAQRIRSIVPGPIDDIKQKVIEYKMMIKFIKKTFSNESSSHSQDLEEQIETIDDKTKNRLKRKSQAYKRELDHRAEMYEKTKGIDKIVNSIQTCNRRLTKLQIEKYNNYMVKYPDHELLLSIKHLVPPHIASFNTKLSKKEQ